MSTAPALAACNAGNKSTLCNHKLWHIVLRTDPSESGG
jgi:hypothetical protein